jgi:hypothetical protein
MHAARQARAIREQRELDESAVERQVEFHPHVHRAAPILSDSLGCPRPRKPISSHNRMHTAVHRRAPLCASDRQPCPPCPRGQTTACTYAGSYSGLVDRQAAREAPLQAPCVEHIGRAVERALRRTLRRRWHCMPNQHGDSVRTIGLALRLLTGGYWAEL